MVAIAEGREGIERRLAASGWSLGRTVPSDKLANATKARHDRQTVRERVDAIVRAAPLAPWADIAAIAALPRDEQIAAVTAYKLRYLVGDVPAEPWRQFVHAHVTAEPTGGLPDLVRRVLDLHGGDLARPRVDDRADLGIADGGDAPLTVTDRQTGEKVAAPPMVRHDIDTPRVERARAWSSLIEAATGVHPRMLWTNADYVQGRAFAEYGPVELQTQVLPLLRENATYWARIGAVSASDWDVQGAGQAVAAALSRFGLVATRHKVRGAWIRRLARDPMMIPVIAVARHREDAGIPATTPADPDHEGPDLDPDDDGHAADDGGAP